MSTKVLQHGDVIGLAQASNQWRKKDVALGGSTE